MSVNGLLLVDKETGITSQGVVSKARRSANQKRIGHSGTLDPGATGLMLLAFGSATRLIDFTSGFAKSYVGEMVLGTTTTTLDDEGDVVETFDMSGVSPVRVAEAAAGFVGEILQVPPMVSAIKVQGKRLHELARQGIEVERKARPATIHSLEVLPTTSKGVFNVAATVSTGTYIRSLVADIGSALGGGAHLRNLRRTAIGPFHVDSAVRQAALDISIDEWILQLKTPAQMVAHLDSLSLDASTAERISNGARLTVGDFPELAQLGAGPYAMVDESGELRAIYERRGNVLASRVTLPTQVASGG